MSEPMRAVRYLGDAGVVLSHTPQPVPAPDEVLVRPTYTGICGTDVHVSHGLHPRVRPPVTLGHEFVGTILHSDSPRWPVGQRVAVEPLRTCGVCAQCIGPNYNRCQQLQILGVDADGSLAEVVAVQADRLLELPVSVPDRLGALVEPTAVAAHAVAAMGEPVTDEPVLIFGGGPIGWLAAVILGLKGQAVHIVETNPFRQDLIRTAGHTVVSLDSPAFHVTAYSGAVEASGTGLGLSTLVEAVEPGATISVVGLPKAAQEVDTMKVISKELHIRGSRVYTRQDFEDALRLLDQAGPAFERLITHDLAFDDAIDQGLASIESGGPVGKILVRGVT